MKNLLIFLMTWCCVQLAGAQSLLQQSGMGPMNFKSEKVNVNLTLNDGSRFSGVKHIGYFNGQVVSVSYFGTKTLSNGTRLITFETGNGFDENFQFPVGTYFILLPNGELYEVHMQNGQCISEFRNTRNFVLANNFITFPKTIEEIQMEAAMMGGGTNVGGGTTRNNSSGNDYDRHKAKCMGCNGSGKCNMCRDGYTSRGTKCSRCHTTGRCQSCGGMGFVRGYY